jgi:hypothetical protein
MSSGVQVNKHREWKRQVSISVDLDQSLHEEPLSHLGVVLMEDHMWTASCAIARARRALEVARALDWRAEDRRVSSSTSAEQTREQQYECRTEA